MSKSDEDSISSSDQKDKSSNTNNLINIHYSSKIFKQKDSKKPNQRRSTRLHKFDIEKKEHKKVKGRQIRTTSVEKLKNAATKLTEKCVSHQPFIFWSEQYSSYHPNEALIFNTEISLVEPTPEQTGGNSNFQLLDLTPEDIEFSMQSQGSWHQDQQMTDEYHHVICDSQEPFDIVNDLGNLDLSAPSHIKKMQSEPYVANKGSIMSTRNSCPSPFSSKIHKQRKLTIDNMCFQMEPELKIDKQQQ